MECSITDTPVLSKNSPVRVIKKEKRKVLIYMYIFYFIYISFPKYSFGLSFFLHGICSLILDLQEKTLRKRKPFHFLLRLQTFPRTLCSGSCFICTEGSMLCGHGNFGGYFSCIRILTYRDNRPRSEQSRKNSVGCVFQSLLEMFHGMLGPEEA